MWISLADQCFDQFNLGFVPIGASLNPLAFHPLNFININPAVDFHTSTAPQPNEQLLLSENGTRVVSFIMFTVSQTGVYGLEAQPVGGFVMDGQTHMGIKPPGIHLLPHAHTHTHTLTELVYCPPERSAELLCVCPVGPMGGVGMDGQWHYI